MFSLIEARSFRSLRYVSQTLGPFHVLVGPNASGKTTFLDVIAFLHDLVSEGLDRAIDNRASDLLDLCWAGQHDQFELVIEATIPPDRVAMLPDKSLRIIRYEVTIGRDAESNANSILYEIGALRPSVSDAPVTRSLFPAARLPPSTLRRPKEKGTRRVFSKSPGQFDNFYPETSAEAGTGKWVPAFRLGPRKSTLANLPEDESRFPVATWFKELLRTGVQQFILNSQLIRRASPPGQARTFKPDGSNLPWVIHTIEKNGAERLVQWVNHVRTALPDIKSIRTIERPEDKHRYLEIEYEQGFKVPSWMVSDGTLRLLALTLPAYLPDFSGVFLVEEPENGIHPRAVETLFQSLSSVYGAQILLATHSPVMLSMVETDKVLCFSKIDGATDIVRGDEHPHLREWRGEENLGVLFAGGVLG